MKQGIYRPLSQDAVSFGKDWEEVLPVELDRVRAKKVFVLASSHLASAVGLQEKLADALGSRLVGFFTDIRPHTPREDVLAATAAARESGADFLLAFGGGSVIDGTKVVQLCLATGVSDLDGLAELVYTKQPKLPPLLPVRMGAVPTTLSGAEFTFFAGALNTSRGVKEGYVHPAMLPRLVVLDPRACADTPADLFLSTGMRSVDHAVEALCSPAGHPLSNAAALEALHLLARGLAGVKADPQSVDARMDCLNGVWLATVGMQTGVPMGASHGIGHALGALTGVPHGITSCLMLPHVMHWNQPVCGQLYPRISAALGRPQMEAPDAVADLVTSLGLPSRMQELGVNQAVLPMIAKHGLHDPWTAANPRRIEDEATLMTLLEAAW